MSVTFRPLVSLLRRAHFHPMRPAAANMNGTTTAGLPKFKEAMESVYGPFSDDAIDNAKKWTPPEGSGGHRGRYLWTDAFGVINFITLSQETHDPIYLSLAIRLTETVHNVLGRTRDGKSRLPGASDDNPVGGGLRIGKEDEGGSDGDGQYHHYLTLWMFALNRLSRATDDKKYNDQAIALAKAIHPRFFVHRGSAKPRMVWKISMDMSKVLVHSQGHLDPVDGYLVFRKLQAANDDKSILKEEIADYKQILDLKGKHVVSSDTLDLGMTLWTSHCVVDKEMWFKNLTQQAQRQCINLFEGGYLDIPTSRRLAFREYGTCLGIGCTENPNSKLQRYRERIIETWENYRNGISEDLRAISEVMRAAAIVPGAFRRGYLGEEPEM